jgi:hypothetical protein
MNSALLLVEYRLVSNVLQRFECVSLQDWGSPLSGYFSEPIPAKLSGFVINSGQSGRKHPGDPKCPGADEKKSEQILRPGRLVEV